jgi:hypothetical protein
MIKMRYVSRPISALDMTAPARAGGLIAYALRVMDYDPNAVVIDRRYAIVSGRNIVGKAVKNGDTHVLTLGVAELLRAAWTPSRAFNVADMYALHLRAKMTPISEFPSKEGYSRRILAPYKASLRRHGFKLPVLLGDRGAVLSMAPEIAAARQLGITEAPTLPMSELTYVERCKVIRLFQNQIKALRR